MLYRCLPLTEGLIVKITFDKNYKNIIELTNQLTS
ncbi:hypothetical protein SAMN04515679_3371 [Pelosinus fermentans]|jgi:hypothetical protein|uniref:Uncharacterized protein n=1 Tax=Pelosinus fermentans B4 TaxID=1149862 RepID=I9B169_9FIRM|nr:hypothetical protein FB4_0382 [Pelosinus fermentans B4]EIW21933.1 hypothetical protein FA11_0740 [Pelosinus fermentans A11]OAM95216.1 hypothetical protein FR7_03237 [Pelosinus fermentans DSM 17108]SDR24899.1 hypothetical protein SAMN04515679_3371 [Pelosinus fermentans]